MGGEAGAALDKVSYCWSWFGATVAFSVLSNAICILFAKGRPLFTLAPTEGVTLGAQAWW